MAFYHNCKDVHNLQTETIKQQYNLDLSLNQDNLYLYIGTNPANENFAFIEENSLSPSPKAVHQRDAYLLHFWLKLMTAGTEFSPYAMLESGFNKDNISTGEDVISQNSDHLKQMRYCLTTTIADESSSAIENVRTLSKKDMKTSLKYQNRCRRL
ncbi:hypothetical protein L1987_44159 [Smallanthus sonchifolius]|uniref:Uncharacterized protein n=1 Tax=Smallanthus sonchifolius TaxID=185202 RepID=A0ACB9GN39_9ASTR|nr:hypothetical protein L1987_44159 [Smallanthus sonchifolius]